MQQRITEFFQFIYTAFRGEVPEFLVVAHEFRVRHALRNLDDPVTQDVLVKENIYGAKIKALEDNYNKVSGIINNTPEPLKPAVLRIISGNVTNMLAEMELGDDVVSDINGELDDILNDYPEPTAEELQEAGVVLQSILDAIDAQQDEQTEQAATE